MTSIDFGGGVRIRRSVACRMSDEVDLISDHYYPAGDGPWPTLLMRQPYGRDIASTVVYAHPAWFARRGYYVVIQDVRGRGDSEGEFYPFRHEARDGAETIAWLRDDPACNGRIGMYGFSYQGATQLLAATEQPEGLVCIAPHMTATDLYHGWFYHHGALRLASTFGWGIQMLREDARWLGLHEATARLESAWQSIRTQPQHAPYAEHPAITDPKLPSYLRDWIAHREPGEYWTSLDVSTRIHKIQVPALHLAGWFDTYLEGSVAGYQALRRNAGTAFAREHQYLIAGPWVHIPWGDRAGEANFGPAANLDTNEVLARWFDHWLKNSGELSDEPRVRYFSLGPNVWCSADDWPEDATYTLFLRSLGSANSRKGDGVLSAVAPDADEPCDVFVHDPDVPVLAPGGAQALSGVFDQSTLELGNNLLVYSTPPASSEMEVFGRPRVRFFAATSAPHADFTVKLVRVLPSGRAEFLSIGIARSSWLFRDADYSADAIHSWEFTLEPIAFVLAQEERLRLEIASSAFPLYDRNPSNDTPLQLADPWTWARSTQRVFHNAQFASALYLPVKGSAGW
ncbi:MAG TPA: CocE/NonD family hydrolase [Terracidiphilus sp.]|nr:CocE/NonD family hydrolase [Terracidiphilus sp.]